MNRILKRLPVEMVFEAGKSSIASTHLFAIDCRSKTHLASKLNGIERRSYEDAIFALNTLQTNSTTLKKSIGHTHNTQCAHVKETERYLEKIGVKLDDLDKLSVIHVAGTKGKGSTCALVESILRNLNVKTGFYSSPHLLNVTERIRLNGEPISKTQFSQYFWKIYSALEETKQHADDMPPYFKFLTIMAYYIFLKENVDVAVVEVGIGGEYDCTNVVRNTQTVGITSLGLEHTQLLGNTYRDIAWQKSGIIKSGSSVFSTHQNDECIPILLERARAKNANLKFIPNFTEYKCSDESALADIASNPTKLRNSSLAIQLSYDWIRRNPHKLKDKSIYEFVKSSDGMILPPEFVQALKNSYWPGRCQTLYYKNITLYIDGAHTIESLQLCLDWFITKTKSSLQKKFLLFNVTGDRNANDMLNLIDRKIPFEEALFAPNISSLCSQAKDNLYTFEQPNYSQQNAEYWCSLNSNNKSRAFSCIRDIFEYLNESHQEEQISVLVTGSLHLVGEVLRSIEEINSSNV